MTPFISELQASLLADASGANHQRWATHIVQNDIALMDIISVIDAPHPIGMRFSWMLGGIVQMDPHRVFPVVAYLFTRRDEIKIHNFERSLAKMFALAGVPEEIEGEAVEALFQWLMNPQLIVSTRIFAMAAMDKLCSKHPELRNELKVVLEQIALENSGTLEKKALAVLGKG